MNDDRTLKFDILPVCTHKVCVIFLSKRVLNCVYTAILFYCLIMGGGETLAELSDRIVRNFTANKYSKKIYKKGQQEQLSFATTYTICITNIK